MDEMVGSHQTGSTGVPCSTYCGLIITCLAVLFTLHDFQGTYLPISTIWHSWNQWDTKGHFIVIATQGYANILDTAFFPLYPILMRGVMFLGFSPLISGLLISNIAGLF